MGGRGSASSHDPFHKLCRLAGRQWCELSIASKFRNIHHALDDACLDSSIWKSGVPWLRYAEGEGGTERSPWFSTRTSHASPDDGDGTFKPYYTVDDGAWDRHAATFSNSIRDPHEGYRNMLGHPVVSCVYQATGK